jgi:hypothetical protein
LLLSLLEFRVRRSTGRRDLAARAIRAKRGP